MSDNPKKESPLHGHGIGAASFLGGITFTAMILMMEFSDRLFYSDILITGTAIVSVLFIISALGMARVASGEVRKESKFSKYVLYCTKFGFFGLMIILPVFILEYSFEGMLVVVGVEAIVIGLYFKLESISDFE